MQAFTFFILAALAITAQALTDEQKTKLKQQYDACVEKTGVDKELIAKARKNDFNDDEKLIEYMDCMAKKMGLQEEDGTMKPDEIIAILPDTISKEEATKVITACTKNDGVATNKIAYKTYKCATESFQKEIKFL